MEDFFKITNPKYNALRGKGLALLLEITDIAILTIKSKDSTIEVRGNKAVGSYYEGSRLDRIIDSIPRKRVNLSGLFAYEEVGVPKELTDPIINALEFEEEMVYRLTSGIPL